MVDAVSNYLADHLADYTSYIPDFVLRFGMRRLLASTLNEPSVSDSEFAQDLRSRAIAECTQKANEQHYEVPAVFYQIMLGPWLKYSSGYWPTMQTTLAESEEAMLLLMCERAELDTENVHRVLDLGCGWGSATLFMAKKFPNKHFTCVSNSHSQCEFIKQRARELQLDNVFPQTQDANVMTFPPHSFDRIVSNEMLEHMKNYDLLLERISTWLAPKGKLFLHIFTHKNKSYHFKDGWMAEKFFTGGTMPSQHLLPQQFSRNLTLEHQYKVNGNHYSRTLEAWLQRMDQNKEEIVKDFVQVYGGHKQAQEWFQNWRLFNMACSELFRYNQGEEWFISHYLFAKKE